MKFSSCLFVVFLWAIVSTPGWSAMNTLTNTDLGRVQADPVTPGDSPPAVELDSVLREQQARPITVSGYSPKNEFVCTAIASFHSSREYARFLKSCRQLEKLSKRTDYQAWANSEAFTSFCSKLERIAHECSLKLAMVEDPETGGRAILPFIDIQKRMHQRITRFSSDLYTYFKGRGPLPEIKQLTADLQSDSFAFQMEYAKYN